MEPPGTSTRTTQTKVRTMSQKKATRNQKRQNDVRRRLTTSTSLSSASSVPYRLGQGSRRRTIRSTRPLKATIVANVARSDQPMPQPCVKWNQTKTAGLVIIATAVATRVRRRHSSLRRNGRLLEKAGFRVVRRHLPES